MFRLDLIFLAQMKVSHAKFKKLSQINCECPIDSQVDILHRKYWSVHSIQMDAKEDFLQSFLPGYSPFSSIQNIIT